MIQKLAIHSIYFYEEICYEEQQIFKKVQKQCQALQQDIQFKSFWGNTLYDKGNLPFEIEDMPLIYTQFRKSVESKS